MRGDSGVADEGRVVGVPKFHSWGKCTMGDHAINEYQLRLDVQRFLWPVYYIVILYYIILYYITSKVTAPQDAHGRLVLQVYLGSNTSALGKMLLI